MSDFYDPWADAFRDEKKAHRETLGQLEKAVEWIGCVRDELVLAGFPGGDRDVALESFRSLLQQWKEALAVCACGCDAAAHESYGEDGESCGRDDHDCYRTSKAAVMDLAIRREALVLAEGRAQKAEREVQAVLKRAERAEEELGNLGYEIEGLLGPLTEDAPEV